MTLPRRPATYSYTPHAEPFGRALWQWLLDRRMFLAGLLLGALAVVYAAMAGIESLSAERDAAVQAAAQIKEWHARNWAQAVIQGSPERVANLAGAVASAVR